MTNAAKDKFKAVWLSHSSIGDFLKCPRLYYLRNVYKDPRSGHKFNIMSPPLALGQLVHEVVEGLSVLPVEERFLVSPVDTYEKSWEKLSGEKGGFKNEEQENDYKERGIRMLRNVIDNPGPILKKAIKIKADGGLPYYWFSEEENIILCGKVDWIEYVEEDDSIHIIDFKTGKNDEDSDSLQLPIYLLLATNLQKRKISKASYWYLDKEKEPKAVDIPDIKDSIDKITKIAARVKLSRQLNHFVCKTGGCRNCIPFERVIKGEGKKVFVDDYNRDIYTLQDQ
jgi:ATP-dependent helicase/DNAse subunit B